MATVDDLRNVRSGSFKLFDIRKNPDDRQIPGSLQLDGSSLERGGDPPFGKDERAVLYCGSGNSCSRIAAILRERGYAAVEALDGGYAAWKAAGLPLEPSGNAAESAKP